MHAQRSRRNQWHETSRSARGGQRATHNTGYPPGAALRVWRRSSSLGSWAIPRTYGHAAHRDGEWIVPEAGSRALCRSGCVCLRAPQQGRPSILCAADSRVYLDKAYLTGLPQRTGRGGEYAVAYLIAHVGRRVQQVLDKQRGTSPAAMPGVQASTPRERLELELQADCYAGVWTHFVQKRGLLNPGDLDGVPAALAAGDPLIQVTLLSGDTGSCADWAAATRVVASWEIECTAPSSSGRERRLLFVNPAIAARSKGS